MIRKRHQRSKHVHHCLFLNHRAAGFDREIVDRLTGAIRKAGGYYTILEPESAMDLVRKAEQVTGKRKRPGYLAQSIGKRGPVTGMISCGGDGTFNLVARTASATSVPVGILPLGRMNNIARSLLGSVEADQAIQKIVSGGYRLIDAGHVGSQVFYGSVGIGFVPELSRLLSEKKSPRLGVGWAQLGARAAADIKMKPSIIKVDAFRFQISPLMFNVNLLMYTSGLKLSPASLPDDGQAEIIFDRGDKAGEFASYVRRIYGGKYLYGTDVHLYRGAVVTFQPTMGRTLYLDGELIEMPSNVLEIHVGCKEVRVFA